VGCRRSAGRFAVVLLFASGCRSPAPPPASERSAEASAAPKDAGPPEEDGPEPTLASRIEVVVVPVDKSIGTPEMVADGTHLYWIASGGVRRVAKTGGASELMMSKEGGAQVNAIAASPTHFAWATDDPLNPGHGAVFCREVKKGTVKKVASDLPMPLALAIDDKRVYFSTMGGGAESGSVRRVRFGGEDLETVARGVEGATRLVLDARAIYTLSSKAAGTDIVRIPKAGGAPAIVASSQTPVAGLAMDDKDVTFSITGPLETPPTPTCKKPPCPVATARPIAKNGELRRAPKAGGVPPTTILGKLDEIGAVDVDATSIIYRQRGELFVLPKSGGTPRPALESSALPSNLHVETAQYIARDGKVYVIAPKKP
jgi:hypothetical protein